jgi:hypothetical protein
MVPMGCDEPVQVRADCRKRWYGRQPCQPSPSGKLDHDTPPGSEALQQGAVVVSNPHRSFVIDAGHGQFLIRPRAEVEEADAGGAIARSAPILRGLAQWTLSVHPDL